MNQLIRRKPTTSPLLIAVALFCCAFLPKTQAVNPPPDGCYPNYTTAEGCSALNSLTTGAGNTGVGWYSLFSSTDSSYNTGVGAGTLVLNTSNSNTAVGTGAMLLNTTGSQNTAVGTNALVYNDTGEFNSAVGAFALFNNIDGSGNSAFGFDALAQNVHGVNNTAIGVLALFNNDGHRNTAVSTQALVSNTDGHSNNAIGFHALEFNTIGMENNAMGVFAMVSNQDGFRNVALGDSALFSNVSGDYNTVVGWHAGNAVEGSDNIYIGRDTADGIAAESGTTRIGNDAFVTACYIAGILGNGPFGADVQIDPVTGRLGSNASSKRFKKNIDPMEKASEAIFSLKPVTFHYKNDQTNTPQFGLIAEEVAKVNPALIAMDKEGKPYTVRYDQVNAMLLNEFLKEHRKVQELESRMAEQEKQIESLTAGLQQVSAQLAAAGRSVGGLEVAQTSAASPRE